MERKITDYQSAMNEIVPAKVIADWKRARMVGLTELSSPGNKVIDCLAEAVKKKYLPSDWNEDIRKMVTAWELIPHFDGRRKEKCLLYWSISRGDKTIHLPVVSIHSSDGSFATRNAVDKRGNFYFMGDRWLLAPGGHYAARINLVNENGRNLLAESGFVNDDEVPPSQLQISFSGKGKFVGENHWEFYPDRFTSRTSLKGLNWCLEEHPAAPILPQFVIEDLGLLRN